MVTVDHSEAIATLLALAGDEDTGVRRRAAVTLSDIDADPPAIRKSLARLLDDSDPDVALAAARGLGGRQDPRADQPLMRAYLSIPPGATLALSPSYDVLRKRSVEQFARVRDSLSQTDPGAADG